MGNDAYSDSLRKHGGGLSHIKPAAGRAARAGAYGRGAAAGVTALSGPRYFTTCITNEPISAPTLPVMVASPGATPTTTVALAGIDQACAVTATFASLVDHFIVAVTVRFEKSLTEPMTLAVSPTERVSRNTSRSGFCGSHKGAGVNPQRNRVILEISVRSKQNLISRLSRAAKEFTVRYRGPTFLLNSPCLVTLEGRCEFPRERFVNEYAQARLGHRLQTQVRPWPVRG